MSSDPKDDVTTDDAIQALIDVDPRKAEAVLEAQGYSLEEWQRAREFKPAVDHSRPQAAAPAAV